MLDALPAAARAAVGVGAGALAVAVGGHGEDELLGGAELVRAVAAELAAHIGVALLRGAVEALQDRQRDHLVAVRHERHAADTGGRPALELAHVGGREADRLTALRGEQHVVALVAQRHADQPVLVAVLEADRPFAVRRHVGERVHRVPPHVTVRGREHDVKLAPLGFVLGERQHRRDRLAGAERQQVRHRAPLRLRRAFGKAPHLETVDLARGREEQHRRMGRGDEELGDDVLFLRRHARAALAAALLRPVGVGGDALDVAAHGHGHDHVLALDQILVVDIVEACAHRRSARRGERLDLGEFGAHHLVEARAVAQNLEQPLDARGQLLEFAADLLAAERRETVEPQVEDGADLRLRQAVGRALVLVRDRLDELEIGADLLDRPVAGEQRLTRFGRRGRAADDAHHLVEVGDGDHEAEQQVSAVARLRELELRPAGDHLLAEADERLDDVAEIKELRPAAADGEHVEGEARLRRRVPPELVEHHFGGRVALEVEHDAHAFAVRLVADVGDALDALVLDRFGDLLDEARLADLVGDFGEHDRPAVAAPFLHLGLRAHDHRAAPGLIGLTQAALPHDLRAGREVRAGHVGHQLFDRDRRIVDVGAARRQHLAEVVRRDVGRHADGDAAGPVHQEVRKARRQHRRLAFGAVVVRDEVDRVLVEVLEQRLVGDALETRLGVAHRGRRIRVHRPEVALAVDQRHAKRPVLRHARQGVVDRGVAVRVVLTHHVADDARRLAVGLVVRVAAFVGRVEDAAVDGLQAVAHVGQRASHDHAHGVIEVARLHLFDDGDRADVRRVRWRSLGHVHGERKS